MLQAGVPQVWSDLSENGNVGTDETILATVWLPPKTFKALGDGIMITAVLAYAANANVKTSKLYFGTESFTVNGREAADSGSFVMIQAFIQNKAGFQRSVSTLFAGVTGFCINMVRTYTEDLNQPIRVRVAGQSDTASDDVICRTLMVEYVPPSRSYDS